MSEVISFLCAPGRGVSRLPKDILGTLSTKAWYLHANREGLLYFKNVQNLVAKLKTTAEPYNHESSLQELRSFLGAIFAPVLKDCYQEVLALPPVDDIHITPDRVSLVICEPCPGGGLHPDLRKFYEALDYKNRILFLNGKALITSEDARHVGTLCDVWLTDPPYADAINYHELSEFFLAWYEKHLQRLFPDWYTDSKRALANTGSDESFRKSMVDCYRNLVAHMPDNGCQIVMFTHQNASVWAGLALILWAAGLRVIAAWTIATETAQLSKRVTTCKAQSSSSCASKPLTIRPSSMNSILKSNTR